MTNSLTSDSIFLDQYQEADGALFAKLLSDPDVMLHVDGVKSEEQIEKLFQRALGQAYQNGDHIWAIRRKSDKTYVGHAALFHSDVCAQQEREILFYLLKPFWGRGYATEAAQIMLDFAKRTPSIKNVWATVNSDHLASAKTCEKVGMQFSRKGTDEDGEFLIYYFDAKVKEI